MRIPVHPRSVLIDSGASLALAYPNDEHHREALAIQRQLIDARPRLFLTNLLADETFTLILARYGYRYAVEFLDRVATGTVSLIQVTLADEEHAQGISRKYVDKRFSYTDATSFAVMERLVIDAAFTFDRNFTEYGQVHILTP